LAAGDSAATYDPIAAQGIQKALADGPRAASAVLAASSGHTGPEVDYQTGTESAFAQYSENRQYFYGLETRWSDSVFWRARQNVSTQGKLPLDIRGSPDALSPCSKAAAAPPVAFKSPTAPLGRGVVINPQKLLAQHYKL
jgi:flavin-dependent dehydrogenase